MTLGILIYEIDKAYKESCNVLNDYRYIPEVSSFLERREADLREFKDLVKKYSLGANVFSVQAELKHKGVSHKFYGGICMKKGEYFKIPKSLEKYVNENEIPHEVIKEMLNENSLPQHEEKESNFNFDKDFAIFDELTEEQVQELLEE